MAGLTDQNFSQGPMVEWPGVTSCKFPQNERKHYASKDMLKTIESVDVQSLGRKHFTPTYGQPSNETVSLRTFPKIHNKESVLQEAQIKQKATFKPTEKPYGHKEKLHLYQDPSGERQQSSSIKTFSNTGGNNKEAYVEGMMGQKKRIDYLDDQRNNLEVRSLGDKIYKNPEYASGFFKDGGLVAGSTHDLRKKKEIATKPDTMVNTKKGTTWKEKVRKDELEEEEKAVLSLFDWEKTTLKEANPKWRDPDEVEAEAPKKVDAKVDPKNAKKAPAKK